jgi:uncharacterized protein YoxC
MAEKEAPATPKKSAAKKAVAKKVSTKKAVKSTSVGIEAQKHVSVEDMHKLLRILHDGLASRDKSVDYLQQQIALNQEQIEQNKKILARRGLLYKLSFILLAMGILVVGFDQHSIVKSFDTDMTNVSKDMDKMLVEMTAMRKAIESMSNDFSQVSTDVSSIDKSVGSMSQDVRGMSYDTHQMNRSMDTMTPPWSPWK